MANRLKTKLTELLNKIKGINTADIKDKCKSVKDKVKDTVTELSQSDLAKKIKAKTKQISDSDIVNKVKQKTEQEVNKAKGYFSKNKNNNENNNDEQK